MIREPLPHDAWAKMFPEGRFIFYEGNDPEAFRKEIVAKFGFDPKEKAQCWSKKHGGTYYFLCPAEHLDAIYTQYPMGS